MCKTLKILAICLAVVAVIALMFMLGYQFSISTSYGLWWLNKIGSVTGINNPFWQWIVAFILDEIVCMIVVIGIFKTCRK